MNDFREWLSDNLRYILLIAGVLLVLVGLFFGVRSLSGIYRSQGEDEASSKEILTLSADSSIVPQVSTAEPVLTGTLEENAVPEVTALMKKYYEALSKQDIAGVMAVVDELPDSEAAPISSSTTEYSNIRVFTKPGPDEDSYVVYTRYNYKNAGQEDAYPGLTESFVRKDKSGAFKIIYSGLDEATSKYIAKITAEDDVQALISEVKAEYAAAKKAAEKKAAAESSAEAAAGESSAEEAETETKAEDKDNDKDKDKDKAGTESEGDLPDLPESEEDYQKEKEDSLPEEPDTEEETESEAEPESITEGIGTVLSNVNVRSEPDKDSDRLGSIPEGSEVEVTAESSNGWRYVRYGDVEGYISNNYLDYEGSEDSDGEEDGSEEEEDDYEHSGTIISSVNIRSGPGFDYGVIGEVSGGSTVTVYGENEKGWWHISTGSQEGYVGQSYISVS